MTASLPAAECELGRLWAERDGYRVELTHLRPAGGRLQPSFWAAGPELESFADATAAHPWVASLDCLDERGGFGLFSLRWAEPPDRLFAVLSEVDVVVRDGLGAPDGWQFELAARDADTLSAFQSGCADREIAMSVEGSTVTGDSGRELTAKQRAALELALEEGYFQVPRAITLEELGERLGISQQAASKRIRRGLANRLPAVIEERRAH